MLEVEMKFRVANAADYEKRLAADFGIEFGAPESESDLFFTNPALGFPNAGKSLRIRRRGNYLAVTFKGPRLDSKTKTREELELPLFPEKQEFSEANDAELDETRRNWIRFFDRLGFVAFSEVKKNRRRGLLTFEGREFEITLDEVPPLGYFTEIETMAPKEAFEAARAATTALARKLDLGETIVKSYLALSIENETRRTVDEK